MPDEPQLVDGDVSIPDVLEQGSLPGEDSATGEMPFDGDAEEAGKDMSVSSNQKIIFVVFTVVLIIGGLIATNKFRPEVQKVIETTSPNPLASMQPPTLHTDNKFGIFFIVPDGWVVETFAQGSSASMFALRQSNRAEGCLVASVASCPILFELKENPQNLTAEQFGQPFYPVNEDIYGGTEQVVVSGIASRILYNIKVTGGQILYIPSVRGMIKVTLQNPDVVPLEELDVFKKIIQNMTVENSTIQ